MLAKNKKRIKSNRTVSIVVLSVLLTCLVVGFLTFSNWKIGQKRAELLAKIDSLQKEIQTAQEKNYQLKASVSQTQGEEYLEKVARESLDLKKPDEDVVVVKGQSTSSEKTASQEKSFWQAIKEKIGI
jgi:cell division protein FtsL